MVENRVPPPLRPDVPPELTAPAGQADTAEAGAGARVTCPECLCRLDVSETSSGGRYLYVVSIHPAIEPKALERFVGPNEGPDLSCPACGRTFNPSGPYRRLSRPRP